MTAPVEVSSGRRRATWRRRSLTALVVVVAVTWAGYRVVTDVPPPAAAARVAAVPVRPVANDCSAGHVVFTFDDGPRQHTPALLDQLSSLHLTAVFFWAGDNILGRRDVLRRALALGNVIGDHTMYHPDLRTGILPSGRRIVPWGPDQVRDELSRTTALLVAYGASPPQYYRPPYGSVDPGVDTIARQLGLRLVMSYGQSDDDNIVDSHDSDGASTARIITNVTAAMRDQTIITMHDGLGLPTLNSIAALQAIVDVMNQRKLCATTRIRPDATGEALLPGAVIATGRD